MPSLEDAIAFAVEKYRGHAPDKGGQPYLLHPLRVMLAMDTEEERRVAVLHDVVEDCNVSLDQLRAMGYQEAEVQALDALTWRKERGESYEAFIDRLLPDSLARKVKLADLADNMDVRRLERVEEADRARLERYARAWRKLRAAQGLR
jgi:(p)ppGpp synthase/HD superfamily hydrolase